MKLAFWFIPLFIFSNACFAQHYGSFNNEYAYVEHSEAPYFDTGDSGAQISLIDTTTNIIIDSVIANIYVKQTYLNDGDTPVDAVYTFPASSRAAVYGLTVKINDRTIRAQIQEKGKARETYETALKEGKSAALLEQDKPNVFTMRVGNILPGEAIEVDLMYTELLSVEDNVYELVYPYAMGEFDRNRVGRNGGEPNINVKLNTAIPTQFISSPTHVLDVLSNSPTESTISLGTEPHSKNMEFILRYQLAGKEIQTGLQLYEGEDENYFLLQLEPPARVEASMIPNREYVFVIDTSGSMLGFPIEVSKALIVELLQSLKPWEKFNVVFFAGNSTFLSPESLDATEDNIEKVLDMLTHFDGSGGTNLIKAFDTVNNIPYSEGYSRSVVTITDGHVSVVPEVFRFIENNMGEENHFAFGVGNSVNRYLIDIIARAGYGESYIALNKSDANARGREMINFLRNPVLTNIDIDFGDFDVYEVQPIYQPDLFANRPITIKGKWRGKLGGKIVVSGVNGAGEWKKEVQVENAMSVDSRALEYLWARQEIRYTQDLLNLDVTNDQLKKQIVALGLKHNLLTNYTSFVAVDDVIRTSSRDIAVQRSNGFYSVGIVSSLLSPVKNLSEERDAETRVFNGKIFTLIDGAWVDERHQAHIPVIEINFSSPWWKALIKLFPDFVNFDATDILFVNLDMLTLKVSQDSISLNDIENAKIQAMISQYEK